MTKVWNVYIVLMGARRQGSEHKEPGAFLVHCFLSQFGYVLLCLFQVAAKKKTQRKANKRQTHALDSNSPFQCGAKNKCRRRTHRAELHS